MTATAAAPSATQPSASPAPAALPVQPQIVALHGWFNALYDRGLATARMEAREWCRPRFFHMLQMLGLTRGVPGCTAEAGVFRGFASYLICATQRNENPAFDGSTHLCVDSFEGLPPGTAVDGPTAIPGRFGDTSVQHVQQTLAEFPGVAILKGWIPQVLAQVPERVYRFVHIDVDLHDATLACLEYFYPRLAPGGAIVVDDYGPWPTGVWPGCKMAVEAYSARHGVPFAALDTGNAVLIKR